MVSTAVTTHAPSRSAGEPVPRAISASTMKTPEPIIDPATMAVELNRPRLCTKCGALGASMDGAADCGLEFKLGVVTSTVLSDFRALVSRLAKMSHFWTLQPDTNRPCSQAHPYSQAQMTRGNRDKLWVPHISVLRCGIATNFPSLPFTPFLRKGWKIASLPHAYPSAATHF